MTDAENHPELSNPFEDASEGLHWLLRHPETQIEPSLYYHGWSARFEEMRWWAVAELELSDTDWIADDMLEEGWRYLRPWNDMPPDTNPKDTQ